MRCLETAAQHRCEMKPLISSGEAKITSARSPIIPAPTRAGAPVWGPSSLTSVLKRKLRSQKSGTLPSAVATNSSDRVEIITSVQRRRRWTAPEKVRMVEETFEPGMTVSLVARRHGVAANQLFTWRRLVAQGSLTAAGRSRGYNKYRYNVRKSPSTRLAADRPPANPFCSEKYAEIDAVHYHMGITFYHIDITLFCA